MWIEPSRLMSYDWTASPWACASRIARLIVGTRKSVFGFVMRPPRSLWPMQRNVACATFPNNYPGLGFYGKKKRFSIHMPWKERLNATQLKRANDELSAAVIRTREALEISQRRCRAMKIALTVRLTRIGELSGKLERARAQNRAL